MRLRVLMALRVLVWDRVGRVPGCGMNVLGLRLWLWVLCMLSCLGIVYKEL